MQISCPKCHNSLPEVETLKYHFCPHCGAEIPAEPQKRDNTFLTIPPDVSKREPKQKADVLSPPTDENGSTTRAFDDQTIEPQPIVKRSRPKIKPPHTPPPSSLFRIDSAEKKEPHAPDFKQPPSAKSRRNVLVAILILLVVVILILGGIFTF